jgi:hypothetical protein
MMTWAGSSRVPRSRLTKSLDRASIRPYDAATRSATLLWGRVAGELTKRRLLAMDLESRAGRDEDRARRRPSWAARKQRRVCRGSLDGAAQRLEHSAPESRSRDRARREGLSFRRDGNGAANEGREAARRRGAARGFHAPEIPSIEGREHGSRRVDWSPSKGEAGGANQSRHLRCDRCFDAASNRQLEIRLLRPDPAGREGGSPRVSGRNRWIQAVKEHGAGRQLVWYRTWPKWPSAGVLVVLIAFSLRAAAFHRDAFWGAGMLAAVALASVVWSIAECGSATGSCVAAIQGHVGTPSEHIRMVLALRAAEIAEPARLEVT